MDHIDELPIFELSALKEIRIAGCAADRCIVMKLFNDEMIAPSQENRWSLTAKGRRALLRGSPLLWDRAY